MKRFLGSHKRSALTAVSAALILIGMSIGASTRSTAAAAPGAAAFLQSGHCYRFVFSVEGTPEWKVLDVLENGWIKAEVDTGSASARRESAWVNTAQLVIARETRCSD
jgi:hypothetical protein